MGWKCAPQVMGLVRGEPQPGQKHRANGRKIAMEAGYERASRSDTLDRTRSNQNEYEGYKSGKEFWEVMEQEASEYRVQVKGKTKTGEEIIREKGLQHNAVIGWAVIYNPPAEVCADWTQGQYKKFHEDCQECMALISPLFRKENIRMTAFHKDEGVPAEDGQEPDGHFHDLGISLDENGHYCGKLIDAKLLVTINKQFPALMRERGWDMDDLDVTDFDRAKVDSDYKAERDFKRGKSGKNVNQHIRRTAEKLMDEAEAMYEAGAEMLVEGSGRMAEADARELALAETEKKHSALQKESVHLTVDNKVLQQQYKELESEYDELERKIAARKKEYQQMEDEEEQQREAISPTTAGSTEFVLRMLMTAKQYKEDEAAQEYLMKFIEAVQRNRKPINQRHEKWREQMREKRMADKMAGDDIQQSDVSRELESM